MCPLDSTFGMLRDRDDAILSDMSGTCFICGASKQSIEATSESFERHVKGSHNVSAGKGCVCGGGGGYVGTGLAVMTPPDQISSSR